MSRKFRQLPGYAGLIRYRMHGGGMDLLRAYQQRRRADRKLNSDRRAELVAREEGGLPPEKHAKVRAELITQDILDELDSVVHDLLTFCRRPGPQNVQLSGLRNALRIGLGTSPQSINLIGRGARAVRSWIAAYDDMDKSMLYRSERQIARQIATDHGIGERSASRYWTALKKREPHQAQWAKQISARARGVLKRSTSNRTLKARKSARRGINFGRYLPRSLR